MDDRATLSSALAGRYDIDREIGRGGMATVYLARDIKHDRNVALKVLHPDLAAALGAERFLAEIRTTANLQHPHILPLHDSGEADGYLFYVMPFVDGESLRQRLEREQQLPVADAVRIASEVAGALDYAHRQGIVHRDIKPENILLHDGRALVADFGIALAVSSAGGQRMTQTGLSLGTPQYMSPEQAMGERTITSRSDIWALGAVTYEMLAGEPPFSGPTVQAIIARLMADEPRPITMQRKSVPPHVEAAVFHALEKLPADRWGTANEFATALTSPTAPVASADRITARSRRSAWTPAVPWTIAALTTAGLIYSWNNARRREPAPVIRAELSFGDSADVLPSNAEAYNNIAILPGDSLIVVAGAVDSSRRGLLLARLATGEVTLLRNTRGARYPSVSPDGRSIAFVTQAKLWRQSVAGGEPVSLGAVRSPSCTAWGSDDRILVCEDEGVNLTVFPVSGGGKDTLRRGSVRSTGMSAVSGGEWLAPTATGIWMIGGGKRGIITKDGLADSSAIARNPSVLRSAPTGTWAQQIGTDRIAWITFDRQLVVAPFDAGAGRVGAPVVLADSVREARFGTRGLLALSRGLIGGEGVIVFADRKGRLDTLPYPLADYRTFDVSPDGRRIAIVVANGSSSELRLLDVAHPASRVLPIASPHEPRWSPDGKRLVVATTTGSSGALVALDPDDVQHTDTLYRGSFTPHAWSPDGKEVAGSVTGASIYGKLARIRIGVDTVPRFVAGSGSNDWYQSFSPDGRWYVFQAVNPAGRTDEGGMFLAENRAGAIATRVLGGVGDPQWSSDGREVVYLCRGAVLCTVPVTMGAVPTFGKPEVIPGTERAINFGGMDIHVLRDGRVAYVQSPPRQPRRSITVITDWRAEYTRRAAGSPK